MEALNDEPDGAGAEKTICKAVGRKIRVLRVMNGESQAALGKALRLTFQQVQKYEAGTNRLSADKLWRIAQHYRVDVGTFFADVDVTLLGSGAGQSVPAPYATRQRLVLETAREARNLSATALRAILAVMRAVGRQAGEGDARGAQHSG